MNRISWLSLCVAFTACVEASSGPLQSGPPPECTTTSQCALNHVCAAGSCEFVGCVADEECGVGEACDAAGSCVPAAQCTSDAECLVGEVCFGGTCYPANTGGGGGATGGGGGTTGGGGGTTGGGGGTTGGGGATGALDPGGWLWTGTPILEGGRINATFNGLGARLRGSNGTRIAYDCDADLPGAPSGSTVYGTGVYTDDSSVCRAAIHAGVIPAAGGRVVVEVRPGQGAYSGSLRNGVTSLSYGAWTGSFALVP